jgi:hypothetical protein
MGVKQPSHFVIDLKWLFWKPPYVWLDKLA